MARDDGEAKRQFSDYFAVRRDVVRRTAYLLCGDWHWADDLAQDAFIRLASSWDKVRDQQALDAFVRTCLIRAYLSETSRVWRRRERIVADPPEVANGHDDAESSVRRIVFARALKQLPPRQRVTLICRFYQGLDVAETAEVMNCSTGTVKSQTARGLAALRALLGDAVDVPPALLSATWEAS
jgi:RNA polymerase sigma-70 factor (sigma-E family)